MEIPNSGASLWTAEPKKKDMTFSHVFLFGGDGGIRTLDLTDANRTLSQLSYAPMSYLLFVPDLHSEALGVPAELQAHI